MSAYIHGTSLSYRDYLQAKSFERSLRGEISSAAKSVIASNEELQRENISVLKSLSSSVSLGFDQISFELGEISAGLGELNATFQWGFSELLTLTGGVYDSLHELIKIARTPAQTWAYEQFEIAWDAFRKNLYDEALEYLDRAINGYGGQTGYKIEYRFHFLLGTIRLGSLKNFTEIVNLAEAERAFLNAARYARQDAPQEAALALLAAGWAAYCQGEFPEAQQRTEEAIALHPALAEAHFQLAKIQMHLNQPEQALTPLRKAIALDRGYMIKAASDDDFKQHEAQIFSLFDALRQESKTKVEKALADLEREASTLRERHAKEFPLAEHLNLAPFNQILAQVRSAASHETYYGNLDALQLCEQARDELRKALEEMRQRHETRQRRLEVEQKQRNQAELSGQAAYAHRVRGRAEISLWISLAGILCIFVAPIGLLLGIYALTEYRYVSDKQGRGQAIAAVVISMVMIVLVPLSMLLPAIIMDLQRLAR